jgi:hypothetical protein
MLADLKRAADDAAERFKHACPKQVPLTPTGRLQVMTERLWATLDAVKLVRPPLEKFYQSLSDEQRARFNDIGPGIGEDRREAAGEETPSCGGDKVGLTAAPIEDIDEAVNPTDAQRERLNMLSSALEGAVQRLDKACPNEIARTPVGRLEALQKRLEAMIEAANTVRPPLEAFYASLNNEQRARLNRLNAAESRELAEEARSERKPQRTERRTRRHRSSGLPFPFGVMRRIMRQHGLP